MGGSIIIKFLDWLADNLELGKAVGLFVLGLLPLVIGTVYFELLKGTVLYIFGGYIALFGGGVALLKVWKERRDKGKAKVEAEKAEQVTKRRHEEQITKTTESTTVITGAIVISEQNVLAGVERMLDAKLAQPTQKEIRELPISEADRAILTKVAELNAQGDAEGVLLELADDSKVAKEIEALAINMAYRHFFRGNAYAQQGKYLDSINSYERSLNYRQDSSSTWTNLGSSLESVGRYAEALQSYEEAIKYDSNSAIAWYNRGTLLGRHLGEYKQAIVYLDKAIELKPDFVGAFSNRGMAYAHLGQLERAILDYDTAIKIEPNYHVARYNRGVALANLDRFLDALMEYNIVVKFIPDLPDVWLDHGVALAQIGRYDEAIQSFDEAIKYHPDSYYAFYNRGVIYVTLSEFEKARNSFKQALVLAPEDWPKRMAIVKQIHDLEKGIPKQD